MQRTETLKLIIAGDGKLLDTTLGGSERRVNAYKSRVRGYFADINRGLENRVRGMLTSPLAIFGGAAAIGFAGKQLIDYRDKLSTVRINAGLTAQQMMALDKSIYDMSFTSGQSRDSIVAAISDIYDKTGDFKFAEDSILGVARASTAMSADMMDSARILSAMRLGMGATSEDATELFDIMARMGNIGSMTFAQQAQQAERLFASSTLALGITKKNFGEYAAFLQSVKPVFGTADIAATAVERVMLDLATKKKDVQKVLGFKIFDEKGAIIDFQKTIKALSKLDVTKRAKLFGEFGRAFIPLASDKGRGIYDNYIKAGQEAGFITDAFSKKAGEAKFQLNALGTAAQMFADAGLSPVIRDATKALTEMTKDPGKMKQFTDNLMAIGRAAGFVAQGIWRIVDGWAKIFGLLNAVGERIGKGLAEPLAQDARGAHIVTRFNTLPIEKRREMIERLNKEGKVNLGDITKPWRQVFNQPGANPWSTESSAPAPAAAAASATTVAPSVKNNINLSIQLHENGTKVVQTNDKNTTVTVNRGNF